MAKFLRIACVVSLAAVVGCAGADGADGVDGVDGVNGTNGVNGLDGTNGVNGLDGTNGVDATVPDPVDTAFSFAVMNNSGGSGNHNGPNVLTLDFDGAAASATTVVSTAVTTPPRLDGRDDGLAAWGGFESTVVFDAGSNPGGITGATLRSAYDAQNIYFFAKWTETTGDGQTVGASNTRRRYSYDGAAWTRAGDEDRASFIFPVDDAAFATGGCTSGCHSPSMRTPAGTIWDVWHWKAARSAPANVADDEWWDDGTFSATTNGRNNDFGQGPAFEPGTATAPAYMPTSAAPGASVNGPVWVWDMVAFNPLLIWTAGSSFPGVFTQLPTGSRADVSVVSKFDATTGTWTLEFKRARWTGNGDDVQF